MRELPFSRKSTSFKDTNKNRGNGMGSRFEHTRRDAIRAGSSVRGELKKKMQDVFHRTEEIWRTG